MANLVCMVANARARLEVADLPLILALARERTLAGAAEQLGVDLSTVFRRLNSLEKRLRVRLFDRSARGYQLTAAGERATGAAERVETELLALDREISGRDQQLSGVLRITASETLAYAVLPTLFAQFHELHPRIQLVLAIDNRVLDLGRREADVALRVRRPTDPALFGRRLTGIAWAFYGPAEGVPNLRRESGSYNFARHSVIGWDEPSRIVVGDWIAAHVPSDRIGYRSNSLVNQLLAVRAKLGIALLPCYLADCDSGVRRVSGVLPDLASELWIVTHQDLKNTARIRTFLAVIGDAIAASRRDFEGQA
ncbi:MAG TPA: LysR family transcriptional regulator [Steroidobacteraceae bacterium]|nr:LysR family transcriptional regulator [Steroidobacteraceae bacterium]